MGNTIKGKTILVTGATNGIGLVTARELSRMGGQVTIVGRDAEKCASVAKQIEALGQKNDVVMAISTSGKAKNVIAGVKQAKKMGLKAIALTGGDGGEIAKLADVTLLVPSSVTARIQEAHITIGHIICELIEQTLCQS